MNVLKITSLHRLEGNHIGATGATAMAEALKHNHTLQDLKSVYLLVCSHFFTPSPSPSLSHPLYLSFSLFLFSSLCSLDLFFRCLCSLVFLFPFSYCLLVVSSVLICLGVGRSFLLVDLFVVVLHRLPLYFSLLLFQPFI